MKEHRFPLQIRLPLTLALAVLLTGYITLQALWFQPNALRTVLSGLWADPLLILLNALPVGLLALTLTCLFQNVFFSAALVNLVVGVLALANRIKIEVRDEPVFPRDLALLKELGSIVSSYDIRLPKGPLAVLIGSTLALLALGFLIRCRPLFPGSRKKALLARLGGAAACFGALPGLIFTLYASNDLYNGFSVSNPYYVPAVFNELGFPYCFAHHFTTYTVDRPAGFNRREAERWDSAQTLASQAPPVHVVMVMNEAFSDLTDHPAFTYGLEEDPLANLHALRQDPHAISGHVVVPGFAGGTANTEFDVLTGMQTNALSATATSALRTVNRNLDSLFRVFAADGYRTSYLHPGDPWFYNRENVYRWLGAEETAFTRDLEGLEYKGRWVTDDSLTDRILERFHSAKADGVPLFSFTTTIQNHMSYTADKYGPDYDFPPVQTDLELRQQTRTLLSVYIEGLRDADAMLGRLHAAFAAEEAPVLLVFFGDHLPYLGDSQAGYQELGIALTPETNGVASFLATYEIPYLIWANDAAAELLDLTAADPGPLETISACYLGAAVLELTGRREASPWFSYLAELRRELPVLHKGTVMLSDGSLRLQNDLTPQQSALVSKMRSWSYYKLKYKVLP